jgi:hypothetical protein
MKTRILHTKIWEDTFVCELSAVEKLAFIYFLTNSHVGLTGIYELSDRVISFDLNIKNPEELFYIKEKLQKNDKIYFKDGFVAIKNAQKYNDYSKGNENQKKAFCREYDMLPSKIKEILKENNFDIVNNPLITSRQLVDQLDINNKSKIINNKTKRKEVIVDDGNGNPVRLSELLHQNK